MYVYVYCLKAVRQVREKEEVIAALKAKHSHHTENVDWPRPPTGRRTSRESIEVRESARVALEDINEKGVVRCSLDSCLLLSSFSGESTP